MPTLPGSRGRARGPPRRGVVQAQHGGQGYEPSPEAPPAPVTRRPYPCRMASGPGQADARRHRGALGGALGGRRHLPLRPPGRPARRVRDRHAAADRVRLAPRRHRLRLHPDRRDRPLPADARQGRLLPDRLGRQRPRHRAPGAELLRRALRPVAAVSTRVPAAVPRRRPERRATSSRLPAELRRALRRADGHRRGRRSRSCSAASGCRFDWSLLYTTIGDLSRRTSQVAFLRNLARGEAYSADAPTLWDVDDRTAVAQAEIEDRERRAPTT